MPGVRAEVLIIPASFAGRHPDAMRPHRWPAVDHLFSRLDHVPAALVGKMIESDEALSSHSELRRQTGDAHVFRNGIVGNEQILPRFAAVLRRMLRCVLTPTNR